MEKNAADLAQEIKVFIDDIRRRRYNKELSQMTGDDIALCGLKPVVCDWLLDAMKIMEKASKCLLDCTENLTTDVNAEKSFEAKLDQNLNEINNKLTSWGQNIVTDMNEIIKQEISNVVPGIVKEAAKVNVKETVKEISSSTKFAKSWADLFKKSQEELKTEANNVFKDSLTTALAKSQNEITETIEIKHDNDMLEKEKRSRNIVIGQFPESNSENASNRLQHDLVFVKSVTGLSDKEILKCIRAGPKEDRNTGQKKTSRPIIVTVENPELARRLHKYGNGHKVICQGKIWWINQDFTISERHANFRARQYKKLRQQQSS